MLTILESTDTNFLADLTKEVQEQHHAMYPDYFVAYNKDAIAKAISDSFREKGMRAFVAYSDGVPVGCIMFYISRKPDDAFTRARSSLHIDQLAVLAQHQRKGIGMALMKFAEDYARAEGVSQVELSHWMRNDVAQKFLGMNEFEYFDARMFKKLKDQ